MLFFVICACFALFPAEVVNGAQSGLALCINALIPSLLPFMVISSCIIASGFSRPLGALLSKILTPITGISSAGCVCLVTGLIGGYGTGARAVLESYKKNYITKEESEKLLAFCNNAGPLFIMGTVGISFFSSKSIGLMLFTVQIITALICARVFGGNCADEKMSVPQIWSDYKKNKPSMGGLVSRAAIESGYAIVTACVFVITFSAILEIIPLGSYGALSGIIEVTRGCGEASRMGTKALPFVSALLYWGGISVHFQANALTEGNFSMKKYYTGKIIGCMVAYLVTSIVCSDLNILMATGIVVIAATLIFIIIKRLFFSKYVLPHVFRPRRHS